MTTNLALEGSDATKTLKRVTTRGALVSSGALAISFILRTLSMLILARLVAPRDFGLVGMVTAVTGFLGLFRDAGLSLATVQQEQITREHLSTLFWVNCALGCGLALLSASLAPLLVAFYHEPNLLPITVILGTTFIFFGAAAQHRALLQRHMRFVKIALIDTISLAVSIVAAVVMAKNGYGYWALVTLTVAPAALALGGTWLTEPWIPGLPGRLSTVRAMLRFGGAVSLNSVLAYLAYNTDKILLGRFLGADVLGIYGRAYQLVNIPTENLNTTLGLVAFPALSRLQNDPSRLRPYFLKGYRLFLILSIPITVVSMMFADDIILVLLGPKWHEAAGIFRLLAPIIIVFGLINPLFWLLLATGQVKRSLKMAVVIAPVVMGGCALGLSHGPRGVAAAFSITMLSLTIPFILWATHGMVIDWKDMLSAATPPLSSAAASVLVCAIASGVFGEVATPALRLLISTTAFLTTYLLVLLFVMKQATLFKSVLRELGLWPLTPFKRLAGARFM